MPEKESFTDTITRKKAARQIAATERTLGSARAHSGHAEALKAAKDSDERLARIAVQASFMELTETQGTTEGDIDTVLELFLNNDVLQNATLARIEMEAEWAATDGAEQRIVGLMGTLFDEGYKDIELIGRNSPKAERSIGIYAGFTEEFGFAALGRKRRLLAAEHTDGQRIQVSKVSTFALDIAHLDDISDVVATEARLIIAAAMLRQCNITIMEEIASLAEELDTDIFNIDTIYPRTSFAVRPNGRDEFVKTIEDIRRLRDVMQRNNIDYDQLINRSAQPNWYCITNPEGAAVIEQAIDDRSALLTPALTTYYAHR